MVAAGLGLAALAAWYAGRADGGGALIGAWDAARGAPLALKLSALVLPAANWAFTSLLFLTLTRAHGRVGSGEMAALIGAAGLYNYLPLRPGLAGRVAYHRAVNGIPVMTSVRILATTIALSAVGVGLLLLASLAAARIDGPNAKAGALVLPGVVCVVLAWTAHARDHVGWRLVTALALRYLDLLVWVARYAVAFALIGRSLDAAQAAAIAGVSQIVSVVPLAGNGLGLREWAVGWAGATLPAWFSAGPAAPSTEIGLSADLIHRAAELPSAVVIGLISTLWIARHVGRIAAVSHPVKPPVTPSE